MSESSMKFTAVFEKQEISEKTKIILVEAKQKIDSINDGEFVLHDALYEMDEAKGIDFDSIWIMDKIESKGTELYIEVIGSPSGTEEQDIITWIKLAGASKVSGEAIFDGGGDVDAFKF